MTVETPKSTTYQKAHCSQGHGLESKTKTDDTIRRLTCASILCIIFIIVEITGGLLSSSLAILSDAAHLFADLASFIVAILAARLAKVPPNPSNTFGYHRAEALAALYSMSCLWIVSLFLGLAAIRRGYIFLTMDVDASGTIDTTGDGIVVDGKIMSATAAVGVVVNLCLAFILGGDHHHLGDDHGHDHSHGHSHGHQCSSHHAHHESTHKSTHETHDDHSHKHDHQNHSKEEEKPLIVTDEENPNTYNSIPSTETTPSSSIHHDHEHGHEHGHESCSHHAHSETHDHSHSHGHQNHSDDEEKSLISTDEENPKSIPTTTPPPSSSIDDNLNLKAAYLHVLADLLQSVCVLISGLIIWYNPHWQICDPFITILFCIFVMKTTYGVIFSSISILMNDVPSSLDWNSIYDAIDNIDGVSNVHDLHIWSITQGSYCISVHADALDVELAIVKIQNVCTGFGIHHTTIQLQQKK